MQMILCILYLYYINKHTRINRTEWGATNDTWKFITLSETLSYSNFYDKNILPFIYRKILNSIILPYNKLLLLFIVLKNYTTKVILFVRLLNATINIYIPIIPYIIINVYFPNNKNYIHSKLI